MKKQITFYLAWDLVFFLILYVLSSALRWTERSYYRGGDLLMYFLTNIGMMMVIGGLICLLAYVTGRYEPARKTVVLEFVMIGGFALYLAASLILFPVAVKFPFLIPHWIVFDKTAMTLGSMLFGYELLFFLIRMTQIRKNKKITEAE